VKGLNSTKLRFLTFAMLRFGMTSPLFHTPEIAGIVDLRAVVRNSIGPYDQKYLVIRKPSEDWSADASELCELVDRDHDLRGWDWARSLPARWKLLEPDFAAATLDAW